MLYAPDSVKIHGSSCRDVYAFGVVAIELYAGFKTRMQRAMVLERVAKQGVSVLGLGGEVIEIISDCIAADHQARPSAASLLERFEGIV